jgi:GntR family transcriptional regulator of arabinose operon
MQTKYEILADRLKKMIMTLEPGMKLPSVREIERKNEVSRFTITRAMNLLEEEGYLIRRSTVGAYSSRPEHKTNQLDIKIRRVLILATDYLDVPFVKTLQQTLTSRGYLSRLRTYDLREPAEKWLPRVRFEGMIFLGSCPAEVVSVLQKRNIPFVCQGVRYAHQDVDNTCGDERMAGSLAAKHLIELGHRKIAVLYHEPHNPDGDERVRGFTNYAQLMNVDARILDCNTPNGSNSRKAAWIHFEDEVKKGLDFTGLFTISDAGAVAVLHVCYNHKIRVPEALSVVGCDDIPDALYLCPSLTTLKYDYQDRANGLTDILEQRFSGYTGPAIQKMYNPILIKRDSTGPVEKTL